MVDLHLSLSRFLDRGREDLAVECVHRILGAAAWMALRDAVAGADEAATGVERLEERAPDRCSRAMYFVLARLQIRASQTAEARESLAKLKDLNDRELARHSPKPVSEKDEPPFPGRVFELLARAELARREGRPLDTLLCAKSALNRAWDLDPRLQLIVLRRFCEIVAWRGNHAVADAVVGLCDDLSKGLPPESLRILDPAIWKEKGKW